jgi:hypothetical protein
MTVAAMAFDHIVSSIMIAVLGSLGRTLGDPGTGH